MEKIFSTAIAAAALIAAASLFFHFVVYLPLTHEQDVRRAEQVRVSELSRKSAADMLKVRCKATARKNYESARESACADAAVTSKQRHDHCVQDALLAADPARKSECDAALTRQTEQCLMAPVALSNLEASYQQAEEACVRQASL